MAINFPTSLDTLTNPTSGNALNSPSHAGQHSDVNDAIEALEAKVGADSSAVATSIDYKLANNVVLKATYDAHTVLYATTDNTPVALTVGEQTVVGRATGGNISALSIDSDLTSVSANDDTIPSAKATKAALDAKLSLAGGTMTGDITLGENTAVVYDPALSADGKYCGITEVVTAGETVAFGNVVYFKAADSKWWKTDADAEATAGPVKIGIVVVGGNADASITIMHRGKIREDDWNWTAGDELYLDTTTAGGLTATAPSGADDVLGIVGYAQTADSIWFEPDNTYIVHV